MSTTFSEFRPRLRSCNLHTFGNKVVVESRDHARHLVFPLRRKRLLEMLDGRASVHEIVSRLFTLEGGVSFRSVFTTLQMLAEAGFLDRSSLPGVELQLHRSPGDPADTPLSKPLYDEVFVPRLDLGFSSLGLFYFLAALIVAGALALPQGLLRSGLSGGTLLQLGGTYLFALPLLLLICSLLVSFKHLLRAALVGSATGNVMNLSLRVHWFSVHLAASETPLFALGSLAPVLVHAVASAFSYLFAAALFAHFFAGSALVNDVKIMALILTMLSLDPYHRSDLSRLFAWFYNEEQMVRLLPYLRNRSLLSVLDRRSEIDGEMRYVAYSCIALVWTVLFGLLTVSLLRANLPDVAFFLKNGGPAERISALVLLLPLAGFLAYLVQDLLLTLGRNILHPLAAPAFRLVQKINMREQGPGDRAALRAQLRLSPLFSEASDATLDYLVEHCRIRRFRAGTRLIIQDTPGRELFFVLKGRVGVLKRESTGLVTRITTLQENAVVGEIALLKECLRTADVVARSDIETLVIDRDVFDRLFGQEKARGDHQKICDRIALGHYISSSQLFCELPMESIQLFTSRGVAEHFPAGATVTRQGDLEKSFYLLLRGRVAVERDGRRIAELGQGEFFGEIALIANVPRTATVRSLEDSLFLRIDSKTFWQILTENINFAMFIEAIAEQRLEKK